MKISGHRALTGNPQVLLFERGGAGKLSPLLSELGCSVLSRRELAVPWELLSADDAPAIIFVELQSNSEDFELLLEQLWSLNQEFPYYLFLVGPRAKKKELVSWLNRGAHEVLTKPIDRELLLKKLELAHQIVVDRRSLREILSVMERYAKHADEIAAEKTRQLIHAERLSTLGTLSAGLAHEIGNPLGYITTSLETTKIYWERIASHPPLADPNEDPQVTKAREKIPKALERIETGLEKVTRLMQSLRRFARSSQGEQRETSILSIVENALEICQAATKGIVTVEKEIPESTPAVYVDSNQIEQVIMNLVVNASHALEGSHDPKILFRAHVEEPFVALCVEDNGPGIPRSKLETIWKPYYTSKEEGKGTGLGLAISKSLVRDNGGTICAENRSEGGARFLIRLPMYDESLDGLKELSD